MREMIKRASAEVKKLAALNCFLISIFLIGLFFVPLTYSDDAHEATFKKGNQLYEKGMYDEAIKEYSGLLDLGLESGNLYFNLGNSYYKKGELGKAIVNYERARRLIPNDSDLKSNYTFALSRSENTPPQTTASFMEWISGLSSGLTLDGLTIVVSAVYILIMLCATASVFVQSIRRYRIMAISILLLVLISGSLSLYARVSVLNSEAIVISRNMEARYEPLDTATTHFTLYEGMKVYILESKTTWSKVRRVDGKVGWVKNQALEKI